MPRAGLTRLLPVAALVTVVVVVGLLVLGRTPSRTYRLLFVNAGQLVTGDEVQVGGLTAGHVRSITLTADNQAAVTISVDPPYAPLHEGTTAVIRAASLSGVANRYVSLTPGPNWRPGLADRATLPATATTTAVDLDELFDAFTPRTRQGLRNVLRGSADQYRARERLANLSAHELDPSLRAATRLAGELDSDSRTFDAFLDTTGRAMGTLAAHRRALTGLVGGAATTSNAIAGQNRAFSSALTALPPALRQANTTFVDLRSALDDLQVLADATKPSVGRLGPFLRELRPVLAEARPTLDALSTAIARPGARNDLVDNLRALPALAWRADTAFPHATTALRRAEPVVEFIRPYVPDLTGWFRDFGEGAASYDANGHYARVAPVFDAYDVVDGGQGGRLVPKPPARRGQSAALRLGNLRRCPGTAGPLPADGSAPFVDSGALAAPNCDAHEVVTP